MNLISIVFSFLIAIHVQTGTKAGIQQHSHVVEQSISKLTLSAGVDGAWIAPVHLARLDTPINAADTNEKSLKLSEVLDHEESRQLIFAYVIMLYAMILLTVFYMYLNSVSIETFKATHILHLFSALIIFGAGIMILR